MIAKLAGRLLTSPLAFLIAGMIDVVAYGLTALRRRAASTMRPR